MENRILLLEDDVSLIDGLQYSLKKNGFDVDFVRSVQETLTYLSEIEKYDMLILDVTLPDGTGFEICEKQLLMKKLALFVVWTAAVMTT